MSAVLTHSLHAAVAARKRPRTHRLAGLPWFASVAAVASAVQAACFVLDGKLGWAGFWHLSAALLAGIAAALEAPPAQRGLRLLAASALSVSLPGIGACGVLLVLVPSWSRAGSCDRSSALLTAAGVPPELGAVAPLDGRRESAALAELALGAREPGPAERLRRLRAWRCMPTAVAVAHWRAALRDPSEELRLLAFALLEQREAALRARVRRGQQLLRALEVDRPKPRSAAALARAASPRSRQGRAPADSSAGTRRWAALRSLAYTHWELASSGLVSGELAHEALVEAAHCGSAALSIRRDGQLAMLMARVCLRRSDGLGGWAWLQLAQRAGVPSAERATLYAEAAFVLGQFEQIPHWLSKAGAGALRAAQLEAAASFWSSSRGNSCAAEPKSGA